MLESMHEEKDVQDFSDLLNGLNDAQREAVLTIDGPVLCLAGAGSGKTRVLTTRIAYMVRRGIRPNNILAVTFTRKAAEEMRERLSAMIGPEQAQEIALGTFHSIGAQILRENALVAGLEPRFGIADESDALVRVRRALKMHGIAHGDPEWRPSDTLERIGQAKLAFVRQALRRHLKQPDKDANVNLLDAYKAGDENYFREFYQQGAVEMSNPMIFMQVYRAYLAEMLKDGMVDFEDLLGMTALLLIQRPQTLKHYQNLWRYISVDEYQDTDEIQDCILRLLAGEEKNILAVGDDDQAIYSFRGAQVENIRTFPERYEECRVIMLEENYRSTPNILRVANHVLLDQKRPFKKVLRSNLPEGAPVRLWSCASQEVEAYAILEEIEKLRARGDVQNLDEVLILYRLNSLAEALEAALRRANIKYRKSGAGFFERKVVKDLLAFLRVAHNPRDSVNFERAVKACTTGIGEQTFEKLLQLARVYDLTMLDAALRSDELDRVTKKQTDALKAFAYMMIEVRAIANTQDAATVLHAILDKTKYREQYIEASSRAEQEDDDEAIREAEYHLRTIDDFVQYIEGLANSRNQSKVALSDMLDIIAVMCSIDEGVFSFDEKGSLNLMSIHASKGLEAPVVFVVGLEEGILPVGLHDNQRDLDEEGRLFYVAITRAKKHLIISSARTRELERGHIKPMQRSRFIARVPEEGIVIRNFS